METHFPLIPGWDVSGVVERVGPDVAEFAPGDKVYGYVRKDSVQLGAYAELVSAHVRMLARKPAPLTWEHAAGVPLAGLTAYQSIKREGETVLVHAAASGVGMFGAQIAAALGARVIGTASERNHDFVRQLGAEPVSYREGLADRIRELAPDGVDAALDFVGGDAVDVSQEVLEQRDRVVSIADQDALAKDAHLLWVRPDPAVLTALAELADAGRLAVHVERVLPLAEAAEAWRISREGRVRGKLALWSGDRGGGGRGAASDRHAKRLDGPDERRQFGILRCGVQSLAQGRLVRRTGLSQQLEACFGDVGVDAAAVGGAEVAREQSAVFEAGDEAGGGALAEDDGVGDLFHLEVAAFAVVLAAEDVEQGVLAHAEVVAGLQGALDVRLDPAVQQGERAPALGERGQRGIRRGHGAGVLRPM